MGSGWLNKLEGFQRSAPGLEWALLKRLPRILFWGTLVPVLLALGWHWFSPDNPTPAEERNLLLFDYVIAGVVVLHWTVVLTVAIGAVIVMVMKGPAYVADAYPLNDSDQPR